MTYQSNLFTVLSLYANRGVVSPFIFLEKTKQKIVVSLESLCFQGRSIRQARIRVINDEESHISCK